MLSRYILGDRGIRGGVRENNANRFLLRINGQLVYFYSKWWNLKVIFQFPVKNGTHFFVTKVFQKGTMFCVSLCFSLT